MIVWPVILSRTELGGLRAFLDAYIAIIPKVDVDSTPLGQRPLCVLPDVLSALGFG